MNDTRHAALIITSIAAPNAVMKEYAQKCKALGMAFTVVGDVSSPKDFFLEGCDFISIEAQRSLSFALAKLLPEKHYARKNIGYLLARDREMIIETDDDNVPAADFWDKPLAPFEGNIIENASWVNVYAFFSKENIWPRGYPLEMVNSIHPILQKGAIAPVIIQGLADGDPDVDAVYRMTSNLPVFFEKNEPILLARGSWCPFNSQNTVWKKEAFPLMYLPSYCSFRMTDIWRSFIAQRIAWTCGWGILFHQADVTQDRNEHSLLKDFNDEIPGYLHNDEIKKSLEALELKEGKAHIAENLIACYSLMIERGWIDEREMPLVKAWCSDISPAETA